ncbi:hypothetical protein Tco_1333227, partial [Tanacetum coccineum]
KFKLEANAVINLSFKLSSFDFAVDITDDAEMFYIRVLISDSDLLVDNDVRGVGKHVYRNSDPICGRMCLYVSIPKR